MPTIIRPLLNALLVVVITYEKYNCNRHLLNYCMKEEYYTSVPYARVEFEHLPTTLEPIDKRAKAKALEQKIEIELRNIPDETKKS